MSEKKKLTRAQRSKRVQIAEDVIKQVEARRLRPRSGYYLETGPVRLDLAKDGGKQVRDVLEGKKCEACALGSMFVAAVDRFDRLKLRDTTLAGIASAEGGYQSWTANAYASDEGAGLSATREDCSDYLEGWFSFEELEAIEYAFETDGYYLEVQAWEGPAKAFGRLYRTDRARLLAIMRNIVENDGEFLPLKHPRVARWAREHGLVAR